jgi:resuscitation-promoting factor RpfB
MDRLNFGLRTRRKARFKRWAIPLWVAGILGMAIGLPGPAAGLALLGGVFESNEVSAAGSGALYRHVTTSDAAASMMEFKQELFDSRPEPKPEPEPEPEPAVEAEPVAVAAPPPAPAGSIQEIIYNAAAEFGISGSYLLGIAQCESTLNPNAVSSTGKYHGLFQYDQPTWSAYGYGSIYDPVAQSRTTARLLAAGQASRWPSCA